MDCLRPHKSLEVNKHTHTDGDNQFNRGKVDVLFQCQSHIKVNIVFYFHTRKTVNSAGLNWIHCWGSTGKAEKFSGCVRLLARGG